MIPFAEKIKKKNKKENMIIGKKWRNCDWSPY